MSYTIIDILQTLGHSHSSALVHIDFSEEEFALWVDGGVIRHMEGPKNDGKWSEMLLAPSPLLSLEVLPREYEKNVRISAHSLAMNLAKASDQKEKFKFPNIKERTGKQKVRTGQNTVSSLFVYRDNEIVEEKQFRLKSDVDLVIGRSDTCDVILPFGDVSSVHCSLHVEWDKALVRDLGSRNGTYINGVKILSGVMREGDILKLGKTEFVLKR